MTLLLGPPGSGKTTLLLALAGKLSKDLKVRHRPNMYKASERECESEREREREREREYP
jgi:ABC-type multidrug transport system ATPase subunit